MNANYSTSAVLMGAFFLNGIQSLPIQNFIMRYISQTHYYLKLLDETSNLVKTDIVENQKDQYINSPVLIR